MPGCTPALYDQYHRELRAARRSDLRTDRDQKSEVEADDLSRKRATGTGIHWQVSQATSLINIVFQLSTASGNAHQGVFMENGSGGYMGDLVFNGGELNVSYEYIYL